MRSSYEFVQLDVFTRTSLAGNPLAQGVEIGRPSEIFVRATLNDDRVSNVRVGGHAIEVLRGTVTL